MLLYEELNLLYDFGFSSDIGINFPYVYSKIDSLSEELIERHLLSVNLRDICLNQRLSDEFIGRHIDIIPWSVISYNYVLSEDFIERYHSYLNFSRLSCKCYISEEFIENHLDWFNLSICCRHRSFSEGFIDRNREVLDWFDVCHFQHLSEGFIESHLDYIDWNMLCSYQCLSEDFLKRHDKHVYYSNVELFGNFSEEFIYENLRNGNFDEHIFKYEQMSEGFLERLINDSSFFKEYYFENICKYQRLSRNFKLKYGCHLDVCYLFDNWLYKSAEEKKQAVNYTGLYECHDDYFIAYKAIRRDRYSFFNFKYRYEKGGIYESWCDCTDEENSFGLSVGTVDYAKSYGFGEDYMIVRCKVRYEDVGRVVHDGDKIRCFKIELLD